MADKNQRVILTTGQLCPLTDWHKTEADNQKLIDAFRRYKRFGAHVNVTFRQFMEDNGKDIFAGRQPKRAVDAIVAQLQALGIHVQAGKQIKNNTGTGRGFGIWFNEPEQKQ